MPPVAQMIRKTMKTHQTMACAIAFAMPQFATAQAAPEMPAASTAASQLHFPSAFADYKPYEDVPLADWRQVNEIVRRSAEKGSGKGGGHDGHGSQEPAATRGEDAAASSAPSAAPHEHPSGHGRHGARP